MQTETTRLPSGTKENGDKRGAKEEGKPNFLRTIIGRAKTAPTTEICEPENRKRKKYRNPREANRRRKKDRRPTAKQVGKSATQIAL